MRVCASVRACVSMCLKFVVFVGSVFTFIYRNLSSVDIKNVLKQEVFSSVKPKILCKLCFY